MTDGIEVKTLARELLGYTAVIGGDPNMQAAALITAATVIIEREVGTAMAPYALKALVDPTLADWARHQPAPG